jgi:hypothetical protein
VSFQTRRVAAVMLDDPANDLGRDLGIWASMEAAMNAADADARGRGWTARVSGWRPVGTSGEHRSEQIDGQVYCIVRRR